MATKREGSKVKRNLEIMDKCDVDFLPLRIKSSNTSTPKNKKKVGISKKGRSALNLNPKNVILTRRRYKEFMESRGSHNNVLTTDLVVPITEQRVSKKNVSKRTVSSKNCLSSRTNEGARMEDKNKRPALLTTDLVAPITEQRVAKRTASLKKSLSSRTNEEVRMEVINKSRDSSLPAVHLSVDLTDNTPFSIKNSNLKTALNQKSTRPKGNGVWDKELRASRLTINSRFESSLSSLTGLSRIQKSTQSEMQDGPIKAGLLEMKEQKDVISNVPLRNNKRKLEKDFDQELDTDKIRKKLRTRHYGDLNKPK